MATKKSPAPVAADTSAADLEKKRLEAEAAESSRLEGIELSRIQTAHARGIRFAKLARKNPMIAEVVERLNKTESDLVKANARVAELEALLAGK